MSVMWGYYKREVKVHYQIPILVRWWEAVRIVGCLEICLWRKINLSSLRRLRSRNPADFSLSSTISLPLSLAFISFFFSPFLTLSVSVFKEKYKQLTMMIKVTGPIKLHMKWLSTLSQHLWERNAHFSSGQHTLQKQYQSCLHAPVAKY